ncbi:hypothetical protein M0R72_04655 [Candidatus Pacearchaeota archaeon]|nr:hypothetical protein [Candidatus Pacearchaeota archaeon]
MQLENLMGYQPRVQGIQTTYFVVGDLENLSASALYSEDSSFKFTAKGIIIPLDVGVYGFHDTYQTDSEGNLSGGHSTINLRGDGKVHMPHGLGMPSIKSGS